MKSQKSRNLYKVMDRFAGLTITLLSQGKAGRAEKCLKIADKLYNSGNFIIQNAVANVFVYSISHVLDRRDALAAKLDEILPLSLRREYEEQVNSCAV